MDINIVQVLFQILNFAIVMFVLKKFVYKPVMNMLDERASKIKDGLNAAENNLKIQDRLEKKEKVAEADARDQVKSVIEDAKKQAKEIIKEAEADAKQKAAKAIQRERDAFQAEMSEEREAFKQQASEVITEAVRAVLADSISVKLQSDLIDKQITQLSAKHLN